MTPSTLAPSAENMNVIFMISGHGDRSKTIQAQTTLLVAMRNTVYGKYELKHV